MTPDERRAIAARVEGAHLQPWVAKGFPPPKSLERPPDELWWEVVGPADEADSEQYSVTDDLDQPTAAFIAHAPTDIRALLSALDAADARAARLRAVLDSALQVLSRLPSERAVLAAVRAALEEPAP